MRKTLKASYTVEAAILIPVVLCVAAVIIQKGICMYQQTREEFHSKDSICRTEAVKTVYRLQTAEDVWGEFGWK